VRSVSIPRRFAARLWSSVWIWATSSSSFFSVQSFSVQFFVNMLKLVAISYKVGTQTLFDAFNLQIDFSGAFPKVLCIRGPSGIKNTYF
jgi:hypothetical protein